MADHEETIRELAYVLWEKAGRPDGRSEEFWHAAVERLASPPKKPAKTAKAKASNKKPESKAEKAPVPAALPAPSASKPKDKAKAKDSPVPQAKPQPEKTRAGGKAAFKGKKSKSKPV